jgi:AbrB family looped-hinge helix DNA binding protein
MAAITVSAKGQVALPKEVRQDLGIKEGSRLEVRRRGGEIVLRPLPAPEPRGDWRSWRGSLAGSGALQERVREHQDEVRRERLP